MAASIEEGILEILQKTKADTLWADVAKEICDMLEAHVEEGPQVIDPNVKGIWVEFIGPNIRTDWTLSFTSPTEVLAGLMVAIDSVKNQAFSQSVQQKPTIQGRPPWVKRKDS